MILTQLTAISPLDGRYLQQVAELQPIWSEFGLMRYRLIIEIRWLQTLANNKKITEIPQFNPRTNKYLENLIANFSVQDAKQIKAIEKKTNHDVKAIEYFLKQKFTTNKTLTAISEFVHFACTSEDINNLAYALMLKDSLKTCLLPTLNVLILTFKKMAHKYASTPMLARTHGQPATPTTLGKELANFVARINQQIVQLKNVKFNGKFNGAVGNYNAHMIAYPHINWQKLTTKFIHQLGLTPNLYTTQIEPHDYIAELNHILLRLNNILLDYSRDMWAYISLNYFSQNVMTTKEVGSSTMPHKINPIDFENAEGNLGLANTLLQHFANKLPISRLQRDLSDSTVLRNLGVALAHSLLAYKSLLKGINKLTVNTKIIRNELQAHLDILAEALQTVMRRYGIAKPYEKLKALTRGKTIDHTKLITFIDSLQIPAQEKQRLKKLSSSQYLGLAVQLAKKI
jgi:adenylosuccinate lyase